MQEEPNTPPPTLTSYDLYKRNYDRPADYTWVIEGVGKLLGRRGFDIVGPRAQPWTQYPSIEARPRLSMDAQGSIIVSLDLFHPESSLPLSLENVTPIPTVYYVLRGSGPIIRAHSSLSHTMFNYFIKFPCPQFRKYQLAYYLSHVDNSVTIDVFVEPPNAVKHAQSRDGRLKWIIDDYQSRVRAEECGIVERQESPYFYSEEQGYRMQAWSKLKRCGNDEEFLGVDIAFLSGEFDARLSPAFRHRATVTLSNPEHPELTASGTTTGDIAKDRVTRVMVPIADPLLVRGERLEVDVRIEKEL